MVDSSHNQAFKPFVLPKKPQDLLEFSGEHFFVREQYDLKQLSRKLDACRNALQSKGPVHIYQHFNAYYSVLLADLNSPDNLKYLMHCFDLLLASVKNLYGVLSILLSADRIQDQEREKYLSLTKMTVFLLVSVVRRIDAANDRQAIEKQPAKRSRKIEVFERHPDWEVKRCRFLWELFVVLELQLQKLWQPALVEEQFVDLICDICFHTLEATALHIDTRAEIETCYEIFGMAIVRYNHALKFPLRIVHMLSKSDQLARSLATGVDLLQKKYGLKSVFGRLLEELFENLTLSANNSAFVRNVSNFLLDMAEVAPKLVLKHLLELSDELLECESHVLRNCVLQITGDIIALELSSEDLSQEMKETRDELLKSLLEHINDVSAFVRAKVLQIWQTLKSSDGIPLTYQLKVLNGGLERLEDKTATVRKFALQLIKVFLEQNPFSANLALEELSKKYEHESLKLELLREAALVERKKAEQLDRDWYQLLPEIRPIVKESLKSSSPLRETPMNNDEFGPRIVELLVAKQYKEAMKMARRAEQASPNEGLTQLLDEDEKVFYYESLLKSYLFLANGCKDLNDEQGKQLKVLQFLEDSIHFSKLITQALNKSQELLLSKIDTDVHEAVELFTTAYQFGLKGTDISMRRLLNLVWSSDKEKRAAVSNAYRRLFFDTALREKAHAVKVVQNLSSFLQEIDCGSYMALECLMADWMENEDIEATIVQVLFERFTMKLAETTSNESRLALQLLILCSQTKSSIVAGNMAVIEAVALGERGKRDPRFYCSCLELLANAVISNEPYKRYDRRRPAVQNVIVMFKSFFFKPRIQDFDSITMRTLEYFYKLCQQPDIICQQVIAELLQQFQLHMKKIKVVSSVADSQQASQSQHLSPSQSLHTVKMPTFLLTRFIHMIGYMTLKEMIFLDIDVYSNIRFRQKLTASQKQQDTSSASLERSVNAADKDLLGATASDSIAETISYICEDVLLYDSQALLSKIHPVVVEICKYPAKFPDAQLQRAAILTLIRLMCVSSKFCSEYLPFLMNIRSRTKDDVIKCNILIGLSDLTFRFPNIVAPWTQHFYETLHEEDVAPRLTALKMLSHLILHEMLRPKSHIADLALMIVDANEEIRHIALQFFKELSKRSTFYNLLLEIYSKLSDTHTQLCALKYRTIMQYLFGFIEKNHQVESLAEKLCAHIATANTERQLKNVTFCLSLLPFNEHALRKLMNCMPSFRDKIELDVVYQTFKLIIANTIKLATPALKALVVEFEKCLHECCTGSSDTSRGSGRLTQTSLRGHTTKKKKCSLRLK